MAARSRATLIVQSETLTGEEISRLLGQQPTDVSERDEPVSRRTPASGRRGHTTWQLASALDETREPEAHLEELLPAAESARSALRQIVSVGGQVRWFCFVTAKPTGNMVWLEPEILTRLAALGIPLVFDIYDSDPED